MEEGSPNSPIPCKPQVTKINEIELLYQLGVELSMNDLEFVIFVIKVSPILVSSLPAPQTDFFSTYLSACPAWIDSYNPGF